jgi:hypothetical protein
MAHSGPDYGLGGPKSTVFPLKDMAELAARLGSPALYDRRGDVIALDTFAGGINQWEHTGVGVGHASTWENISSRFGGFCCHLKGGQTSARYQRMRRYLPFPVLGKVGIEFSFAIPSQLDYARVEFDLYNGTSKIYGWLEIDIANDDQTILNGADGLDYEVATRNWRTGAFMFHAVKVVIDLTSSKYERIIMDDTEYDVSDVELRILGDARDPYLSCGMYAHSLSGRQDSIYVGHFIATQNES